MPVKMPLPWWYQVPDTTVVIRRSEASVIKQRAISQFCFFHSNNFLLIQLARQTKKKKHVCSRRYVREHMMAQMIILFKHGIN